MQISLPGPSFSGWSLAGTWSYGGTLTPSVTFTGLGSAHDLMIECVALGTDAATSVAFTVSSDNGNTFAATGYRRTSTSGIQALDSAGFLAVTGTTGSRNPWVAIENWGAALNKIVASAAGAGNATNQILIANALNAIKVLPGISSANFNAGTINAYAR